MIGGATDFITSAQLPVYTFSGDTVANQSNCTGACLTAWPAVAPPAGATLTPPWSSFTRSDNGQAQLAYNGMPVYTFFKDSALTATGDGVQNFHLLHPPAATAPAPQPSSPPQSPIY